MRRTNCKQTRNKYPKIEEHLHIFFDFYSKCTDSYAAEHNKRVLLHTYMDEYHDRQPIHCGEATAKKMSNQKMCEIFGRNQFEILYPRKRQINIYISVHRAHRLCTPYRLYRQMTKEYTPGVFFFLNFWVDG